MTYTPSNRPVPSDAPEDLYFNSSLLDTYANSSALTMTDRVGVERLTLAGIRAESSTALTVLAAPDGATKIGGGATVVASIAELRALSKTSPSKTAIAQGYYLPRDGGGGVWALDPLDTTSVENGGTVIVANDGGRWKWAWVNPNVKNFGASWNGASQPLSTKFSTLAAAQAVYPHVTALTQELDWAATQAMLNWVSLGTGGVVRLPEGRGRFGTSTVSKTFTGQRSVQFVGAGQEVTQIIYSGAGSAFDITYGESNWWINVGSESANGTTWVDVTFVTDTTNTAYGVSIYGGVLAGRPPRSTFFTRCNWRGFTNLTQCFARGVNLLNTANVYFESCKFFQAATGQLGVGVYARVNQIDGNQAGGGYYFNQCDGVYGDAWLDLGAYIEGVYLTNCATDGGIKYGVRWDSPTAESGIQIIGGQYSSTVCGVYLNNIIDGCITGADFRCPGSAANWIGIQTKKSHGLVLTGNNFIMNSATNSVGIQMEDNQFGVAHSSALSANRFKSGTHGVRLLANTENVQVSDDNIYSSCTNRVTNLSTRNPVRKAILSGVTSYTLTGGAATETRNISVTPFFLDVKADEVDAHVSDAAGIIVEYLFADAATTAVNAVIRFRMANGTNLPAGAVRVMWRISGAK